MICHSKQPVGISPAKYQGSWAPCAQAEKVHSSSNLAVRFVQHRPLVQPMILEVRQPEPAWAVAFPTSQPPQPPCAHAHTRVYVRDGYGIGLPLSDETLKQVRKVRRLGRASIHAGSSRLTFSPAFSGLDRIGRSEA